MTEQMKMKTWSWSGDHRTWRLDPPNCDCDKLCKNPEHDRPEWRLVSDIRPAGAISVHEPRLLPAGGAESVTALLGQRHADVVKAVNTGDLKSPGRRPLRVRFPPSA